MLLSLRNAVSSIHWIFFVHIHQVLMSCLTWELVIEWARFFADQFNKEIESWNSFWNGQLEIWIFTCTGIDSFFYSVFDRSSIKTCFQITITADLTIETLRLSADKISICNERPCTQTVLSFQSNLSINFVCRHTQAITIRWTYEVITRWSQRNIPILTDVWAIGLIESKISIMRQWSCRGIEFTCDTIPVCGRILHQCKTKQLCWFAQYCV